MSESSLKRWIDAGRIRATRTEGGHRRITISDAIAFIRESGSPVLRPELLGLPAAPSRRHALASDEGAFYRALVAGDAQAVRGLVDAHVAAGAPIAELCDGPLRSAMNAIGELWQHDADGVFIEHRATDLCIQALAQLRATFEPHPHAPVAVGGAPEDDPYLLPSAMAALVLSAQGFRAINLGPDTPTAALHRAVAHHSPRLVWVSVSAPLPLAQAHEIAAFLHSLPDGVLAITGGRHHAAVATAHPAIRAASSMAELAELAKLALAQPR